MKTHSKSNNFIAILIALLLFAIGFILYFVHEQTQSDKDHANTQTGRPQSTQSLAVSASLGSALARSDSSGRFVMLNF